jgi:hypothetical protein
MASGFVCRANRPNTWPHRQACKREESPCQLGAVHTWHFTSVRCDATIWSLLEVKRTCRARRDCVDPTRMTPSGHWLDRVPPNQCRQHEAKSLIRCCLVTIIRLCRC